MRTIPFLNKFRLNRRTWTMIACGVGVMALGSAAWAWYRGLPPAPNADPKRIVAYVATEDFAQLPPDKKQSYLDAVSNDPGKYFQAARESNLSDQQRHEAMGNFFMARAEAEADKYFALAADADRDAYLDKLIDEMEQRRAQWAGRMGAGGSGAQRPQGEARPGGRADGGSAGGHGNWGSAERQKSRMEKIPPGARAKMAEFRKAMRDRRAARGLPPFGGHGH